MFCSKCGAKASEQANFCLNCGVSLSLQGKAAPSTVRYEYCAIKIVWKPRSFMDDLLGTEGTIWLEVQGTGANIGKVYGTSPQYKTSNERKFNEYYASLSQGLLDDGWEQTAEADTFRRPLPN